MPVEAKPLFRPDVLRPHLTAFTLPERVQAHRPALARWAGLFATGQADQFKEHELDIGAFLREGRVYGGGLYKIEPKELGRLGAEPVVEAIGKWKPTRQRALFADG